MKADITIKPIIKLIPYFRGSIKKKGKFLIKYSINLNWLIFHIDIDNY